MSKTILGETIDIHSWRGPTVPHHENEIAQSETLSGKPLQDIGCIMV